MIKFKFEYLKNIKEEHNYQNEIGSNLDNGVTNNLEESKELVDFTSFETYSNRYKGINLKI